MTTVTIIGAGMMGSAVCWPLRDNGIDVHLVGTPLDEDIIRSIIQTRDHPTLQRKIPNGVKPVYCDDLTQALVGTDMIVNGVSSFGTNWFAQTVGPQLRSEIPVIAVTKGLAVQPDGYFKPLPAYIDACLPSGSRGKISLNAIGGPCIAHELAARRETCVVFTGHDLEILQRLKESFATPYYHVRLSKDLHEIEICAALKNGYALAVGMMIGIFDKAGADGLASMYNAQAALFAQSCREMRLLLKSQNLKEEYANGLPGAGDLYVTVYGGRTLMLGRLLGQGISFSQAMERMAGVTLESTEIITQVADAIEPLEARGLAHEEELPLIKFLNDVIRFNRPVEFPWEGFFGGEEWASYPSI
jgi:glycerol-3-phosphate dehydrogenase (NAD(P)+)